MMITEEFEERSQSLDLLVPTSILMIDTFPRFPPGIGTHLHTVFIQGIPSALIFIAIIIYLWIVLLLQWLLCCCSCYMSSSDSIV